MLFRTWSYQLMSKAVLNEIFVFRSVTYYCPIEPRRDLNGDLYSLGFDGLKFEKDPTSLIMVVRGTEVL